MPAVLPTVGRWAVWENPGLGPLRPTVGNTGGTITPFPVRCPVPLLAVHAQRACVETTAQSEAAAFLPFPWHGRKGRTGSGWMVERVHPLQDEHGHALRPTAFFQVRAGLHFPGVVVFLRWKQNNTVGARTPATEARHLTPR